MEQKPKTNQAETDDKQEGWLELTSSNNRQDIVSEELQQAHQEHAEHIIGEKILKNIRNEAEEANELGKETLVIPIEIARDSYWLPDILNIRHMTKEEKARWRDAVASLADAFKNSLQ